jgi:uncharacterized protein YlxP (DUF503 family)
MIIGVTTLHLQLPGCQSLKDKRSRIKPLLARLPKEFNVAVAEVDYQDHWQAALIAVVTVANEAARVEAQLELVPRWVEHHFPDITVLDAQMELR